MAKKKVCFKCKEEKPLSEFYGHPRMADEHLNKCKSCTCHDVRERRATNPKVQEYDRKRYQEDPKRHAYTNRIGKLNRKRWPEKYKAQTALGNAVRDGRIKKPKACSRCNVKAKRIEGHHEDYTKPLEVIWLCTLCHRRYF